MSWREQINEVTIRHLICTLLFLFLGFMWKRKASVYQRSRCGRCHVTHSRTERQPRTQPQWLRQTRRWYDSSGNQFLNQTKKQTITCPLIVGIFSSFFSFHFSRQPFTQTTDQTPLRRNLKTINDRHFAIDWFSQLTHWRTNDKPPAPPASHRHSLRFLIYFWQKKTFLFFHLGYRPCFLIHLYTHLHTHDHPYHLKSS